MIGLRSPGRGGLLLPLLAVLMICSAGVAQPFVNCPNEKGGDCSVATPGIPGCQFQSCCETVCMIDPACCVIQWDETCAEFAEKFCTFCGPGQGDCHKPNGTPGCDDEACCDAVCEVDPSCCEKEWDIVCAQQAEILCSCEPSDAPANDDCDNAIDINEGDTPFTTLCANPDGPQHPGLPCGQSQSEDLGRDVWFHYTATFTGTARADTCSDADYNTELAVYDGCVCPVDPESIIGCDAAGEICFGFGSQVIFEVETGNCYTIRVGGIGTASGSGTLSVGEDDPPEPPANDNCDDALTLLIDQPTEFDSSFATTDGGPSVLCSFDGGDANIEKDIWYEFTPDVDGTIKVSLCDSSFDTKLAVYDEDCVCPTPGNPIVCNDDFCDSRSQVSFNGVAGQCYKIRVGSVPSNSGGPGVIEVSQTAGCATGNTTITHSLDTLVAQGNSIACLGDPETTTADNAYARSYDLGALLPGEPIDVNCVTWGIEINNAVDVLAQVNLYLDLDGGAPIGPDDDLILLANKPLLIVAGTELEPKITTFDPPIAIPADIVLVVELALPDTNGITGVWVGSNPNGQTAPSYLRSEFCGVPTFIDIADIGCPGCEDMHIVNIVTGTVELPTCPWDLDDTGVVGLSDLLDLLGAWGSDPGGPPDFDDDGTVGLSDLLVLLANWGPCP